MTVRADEMVITPRFKRQSSPRRQEQERRKEQNNIRKKNRANRKKQRARMAKSMAQGRGRIRGDKIKIKPRSTKKSMGGGAIAKKAKVGLKGAKMASRGIPIIGWAALLADVVILGGQAARQFGGDSDRLVKMQDAYTMFGDVNYDVTANQEVRDFFESDAGMLKAIGQEKKMNSSMTHLKTAMLRESRRRAEGADHLHRAKWMDSPDTLLDKTIAYFQGKGIPNLTDETITKLRALGHGNVSTGR